MTITYLKSGKPDAERADDDAKVRGIVESTLKDIETRGDTAVRELSEKFDKFSPPSFRLSPSEIEAAISEPRSDPSTRTSWPFTAGVRRAGAVAGFGVGQRNPHPEPAGAY